MFEYTKPTMIQETMSNVGKNILTVDLHCIFHQDSYRVAPLKFQNMVLNSYTTSEGLEMGWVQATQAEAAGIAPHTGMNPILLKPTMGVGNQVIVHGISRGNMRTRDCPAYERPLVPDIMTSYRRPEEQYDVIAIEGAGSPAEISLKSYDIMNMGMANMVDVPVPLVGDIDRGDVFAQLCGTVSLLTEEGGKRVEGLIINKFKDDRSILEPGIPMLEVLCHIPVVGMIPYMDADIEDEDSLSSRSETSKSKAPAVVDLAMIRFPRISNFMGFDVFPGIPRMSLRYITGVCDPGSPDMATPPGTKNTIQDSFQVCQNGLETAILRLADCQVPAWGICSGYRTMGEVLEGAMGVESDLPSRTAGMGLLPLKTKSEEEKIRIRVEGMFDESDDCLCGLSGKSIEGYKIRMSRTYIDREEGAVDTARIVSWRREPEIYCLMDYVVETGKDRILSRQTRMDGQNRGNIYGTYIHEISDSPRIARAAAEALVAVKGLCLEQAADVNYRAYREQQYDKLAESLREHLDMDAVYRIMDVSLKEKREEKPDDGYTAGIGVVGRY